MQVTLNLDTPEKQAFFLSLVTHPATIVNALKGRLDLEFDSYGLENVLTGFESFTRLADEREMYELLHSIFTFEDWLKVLVEFEKV